MKLRFAYKLPHLILQLDRTLMHQDTALSHAHASCTGLDTLLDDADMLHHVTTITKTLSATSYHTEGAILRQLPPNLPQPGVKLWQYLLRSCQHGAM